LMCRSSLFFLPFILIGVYYFRPKAFKHVKKTMWILLLFSYILLLPWVARNAYHFKEFIPFERNAAAEDIYVASLGEISDQLDEPILRIVKKEKSDRIYQEMLSASINNILERPGRYISSYFLRFSFIMGELKFLGILGESSVLFYFFFLWGVFAALKSRKSAPLVLLLIYFIGIHIFMAIRLRHMFTIIPLFCVFVALGIASFIQKIGLLWRKKLLIETEKVSSWRMARKWISMGSFSLLSLFYLFALFFIRRELWTYIIVKPAAFAKFAPISQVTNDAYKLETQQPLVHFVENYARVMADKNLSLTANGKLAKHSKKYKHYPLPTTLRLITNKMVLIPSGKFYMGSRFWVGKDDEHPRHEVYLDDFFIDKYETTAGEYIECVKAGKCEETRVKDGKCNYDRQERANHPANCVNWHQANAYCKWLGKRLPSEAEWEKAARGIDGRKYPWGDERVSCKYAIIDNSEDEENLSIWSLRRYPQSQIFKRSGCGRDITWFIGSKPKGVSPYGVMDMIGNVSEWVSDWYDENYYNESLNKNPNGSLSGKYRVARGCSWHDYTGSISAAFRFKYLPVYNNDDLGFRCAANVAAEPCSTMKEAKGKKSEANKEIK